MMFFCHHSGFVGLFVSLDRMGEIRKSMVPGADWWNLHFGSVTVSPCISYLNTVRLSFLFSKVGIKIALRWGFDEIIHAKCLESAGHIGSVHGYLL